MISSTKTIESWSTSRPTSIRQIPLEIQLYSVHGRPARSAHVAAEQLNEVDQTDGKGRSAAAIAPQVRCPTVGPLDRPSSRTRRARRQEWR